MGELKDAWIPSCLPSDAEVEELLPTAGQSICGLVSAMWSRIQPHERWTLLVTYARDHARPRQWKRPRRPHVMTRVAFRAALRHFLDFSHGLFLADLEEWSELDARQKGERRRRRSRRALVTPTWLQAPVPQHVVVRMPDGRVVDPSEAFGMRDPTWTPIALVAGERTAPALAVQLNEAALEVALMSLRVGEQEQIFSSVDVAALRVGTLFPSSGSLPLGGSLYARRTSSPEWPYELGVSGGGPLTLLPHAKYELPVGAAARGVLMEGGPRG